MKEEIKKNNFKGIIVVLSIVILLLVGALVYFFNKEKVSIEDNTIAIKTGKTKLEENNKSFQLGEKVYKIKYLGESGEIGTLYLNDKKIADISEYVNLEASFVDNYLFIEWPGAQGGSLVYGYFDNDGNYYDISKNDPLIFNVSYTNGKWYCYIEDDTQEYYDTKIVKLTLNGNKAIVDDIQIEVTRNGVTKKESVPKEIIGEYFNDKFDKDYFSLFADGGAEAFLYPDVSISKVYFVKDELTYKLNYVGDKAYVELVPTDSLDEMYKPRFGKDGSYYYVGKLINGEYVFEVVNPTPVATPGENKFIKKAS